MGIILYFFNHACLAFIFKLSTAAMFGQITSFNQIGISKAVNNILTSLRYVFAM